MGACMRAYVYEDHMKHRHFDKIKALMAAMAAVVPTETYCQMNSVVRLMFCVGLSVSLFVGVICIRQSVACF